MNKSISIKSNWDYSTDIGMNKDSSWNHKNFKTDVAENLITVNLLLLHSFSNRKFIIQFWLIIERPSTANLTTAGPDQPPVPQPEILPMPKPTDIRK